MEEPADCHQRTDDQISREAAEWFALLLDGREKPSDRQRFRDWLLTDDRNARAYAELEQLWSGAGMVRDRMAEANPSRRTALKTGGAAIVLLAAGYAGTRLFGSSADYRTGTGETATVTLPDGSTAQLSTRTAFSIDFAPGRRRVVIERGEVFFDVAPDSRRPFTVEAADLNATALGTAYSVGFLNDGIEVTVAKHAVSVSTGGTSQRLVEGDTVIYRNGRLSVPVKTDVEQQLSWRNGKLVFLSTPLANVVSSLSRWRTGKIVIMDDELARRPVTIIVDVKRSGTILDTLALGLPITVRNLSPWLTLIYPK
ncbi:FecR family protein [Neorhizobium alkalisoli]|uniref:FecR family protein n=1 Tax=Neorhizobium alkalisoli TaxID=528178 RepID=UPI000CFA194B|nr:FecR family protein [Neorhizobium alkalisoli]